MENSVGSAIEKIKLQEQDKEAKLKERREYEATLTSLQRAIKETMQHVEKSDQEHEQLERKIDILRSEVVLARTRKDALTDQLQACKKELEELRATSNNSIMKVWQLRSSLCNAVQEVVDDCDVRALLIKPLQPELTLPPVKKTIIVDESQIIQNEALLRIAIEKKDKAMAARDRLLAEPEMGEEFVRIKNALQYSYEMIKSLNN